MADPKPIDPGQAIDPSLAAMLGMSTQELEAAIGSVAAPTQSPAGGGTGVTADGAERQLSLPEMIQQSALAVSGREALGGDPLKGPLPSWAADLSPEILGHPGYDPYFGMLAEPGDDRVYMGERKRQSPPPTQAISRAPSPADLVSDGAERVDSPSLPVQSDDPRRQSIETARDIRGGRNAPEPGSGDLEFRSGGNQTYTEIRHERKDIQRKKREDAARHAKPYGDKTLTITQAMNLPFTWDEQEVLDAMERMRASGINVQTFDDLSSVWKSLVERASMSYAMSAGRNQVTPWDVLDLYKSEAKAAGAFTNYQHGRQVTTTRSVADITDGQAWTVLQETLSRMLGRDPTDQELRDYTYKMNQMAAANPTITKTIQKYRGGKVADTIQKTNAGFTSADMAMAAYEDAQSDPGYAEYQAATTYFNAAMSALGAIGQT